MRVIVLDDAIQISKEAAEIKKCLKIKSLDTVNTLINYDFFF